MTLATGLEALRFTEPPDNSRRPLRHIWVVPMPRDHNQSTTNDDDLVHDINRITRDIHALGEEIHHLHDTRAGLIHTLNERMSLRRIEQATGLSVGSLQKALKRPIGGRPETESEHPETH